MIPVLSRFDTQWIRRSSREETDRPPWRDTARGHEFRVDVDVQCDIVAHKQIAWPIEFARLLILFVSAVYADESRILLISLLPNHDRTRQWQKTTFRVSHRT
jgi:hypothetical protein